MPGHRDISALLAKHGFAELRKIGEGSFGKAILVQSEDGAKLVCKMVDVSQASPKETQDAVKESRLLAALKHPYIVRYRQSFIESGWLCILMDYCEGGDLSKVMETAKRKGQRIPEEQILRWITQALLALKFVHEKHVLHRDLKSGNFFISSSGNLKMGDFGIAKVLSCTAACARTQIGTPYYLSPEVCQEKPYTWPSDIWAMGCILYELCALKVPFDAPNISSLVQRICRGPTPQLPSGYSDTLRQLCNEMLHRNPNSRPSAETILLRPAMQAMVKQMLEQAQAAHEGAAASGGSGPEGAQEATPSLPSAPAVSGPYAECAGSYRKGDLVEYHSSTHRDWLPAQVIDVDPDGRVLIDLKPGTWIPKATQAMLVRPRRIAPPAAPVSGARACATPQRQRSPSVGRGFRDLTPGRGVRDSSPWGGVHVPHGGAAAGAGSRADTPVRRRSIREPSPVHCSRNSSPWRDEQSRLHGLGIAPAPGVPGRSPLLPRPSRAVNAAGAAIAGM
eukprot:TRINITY_DN362_c0_g1_i1.p1 TRINITY_DN362_c0_g1~~TRINITY_DN362_c0_g1_i1.p1  ORF type:complete len:515 (+),score=88.94 TRINITY_DN362_c0_g1_i1:30-1547(+)